MFLVSNGAKLSRVEDHANAVVCLKFHECQLGQASANHSESYPLMITPTARTATHATAT